ncbi:MAG: hypothetical protein NTW21_31450 [Verrucomicrobia bacterium]|nr:hypothetical protein [Verrucomicrobiota bacterium]
MTDPSICPACGTPLAQGRSGDMCPACMSPAQAGLGRLGVDTRSDIHSLAKQHPTEPMRHLPETLT